MSEQKFIIPHDQIIVKDDRQKMNEHKSVIIWFTGLSGSGKSTLANRVQEMLFDDALHTYLLDGDNVRQGLNKDLGFSAEDRQENIRRIGEVAKLFVDAGTIVMTAFISPYITDRQMVRDLVEEDEFVEVFVKCPLEVCEERDTKGLYAKARQGLIKNFTGIDDPYDEPENAELVVDTDKLDLEESALLVISFLKNNGYIQSKI
ncbi:MAG: adenylyl-sulfate kinase [Bacteroidetes bacterium]|nr:adenylyl-sulfate kinase [Bacteroidota bacterium]